jgi:hypothetical protein
MNIMRGLALSRLEQVADNNATSGTDCKPRTRNHPTLDLRIGDSVSQAARENNFGPPVQIVR